MEDRTRVKLHPKSTSMAVKPTFKKVQVVYYVSKNGQLEHPHVVEVTHLALHHLRLKDVLERLSVLRGRGMPCLYSWSCKRMYKNGYVWNDLSENDVICPSEGDEYVLKASQLVHDPPDTQLQTDESQSQPSSSSILPKRKPTTPIRHTQFNSSQHLEELLEYQEKRISYTNANTLSKPTKSPSLSTTSGDTSTTSKRFDPDSDPDPTHNRNSLLLHFMACGGSMGFKGKVDHHSPEPVAGRKSSGGLHKGVLCKVAAASVEDEICCMSENPRFGNLQAEEREYFSGSIVEAMAEDRVHVEPMLTKSTSYNEERRSKSTMSMVEVEEEMKREKGLIGKCLPKRFC